MRLAALALLATAPLVAGCGAPHLKAVERAKADLPGRPASTLDRCLGAPLDVERFEDGAERRTYASAQRQDDDGRLLATPRPSPGDLDRACVFTFTIDDDRIITVASDNRAGWGFGSIKRCSALVRTCVAD